MRQAITKQIRMREAIQKNLNLMEEQKADVEVQRETLRAQIAGLEKGKGSCFPNFKVLRKSLCSSGCLFTENNN